MACIHKKARDKGKKNAVWYVNYTDHLGKRRTVKGFTDRRATEQMAAKLEHEVMLRKRGLVDPEKERELEIRSSSLEKHLSAFEKSLSDNTTKYIKQTTGRIRRVIQGCGFESVSDLNPEKVESFVREYCSKEGSGRRTYNHYIQAIDGFCNWMVLTRRIPSNPLMGLERLNAEVDIRHQRRALTAEEVVKLVHSARESDEEIQCYDGETRARLYILAYFTGLRRRELASLTPASFRLDATQPTVIVEAACSKHRRKDALPLHPELVEMLRELLVGLAAEEPLFPLLEKRRTWLMVKLDLERVGIPYRTVEGVADFHAAGRHTYITELLRSGASLVETRELARHSDVRMTMRYTHIGLEDQAQAVSKLKGFSPAPEAADSATPDEDQSEEEPESCPRSGHAPVVAACQDTSTIGDSGVWVGANDNPCGDKGYRQKSPSDGAFQKWRRRESNPQSDMHFALENKGFCASRNGLAAAWQRNNCQCSDDADSDLQIVRELHHLHSVWPQLDDESRQTILYLVGALQSTKPHLGTRPDARL